MDMSLMEEKIIKRHRSKAYLLGHILLYISSILGIVTFVAFTILTIKNVQARKAYTQKMLDIKENAKNNIFEENTVLATQWETPRDLLYNQIEAYASLMDSIDITSDVLGLSLNFDFLPMGIKGRREYTSTMDILSDCGCENIKGYDLLVLKIDPSTLKANVFSSKDKITMEYYKELKK